MLIVLDCPGCGKRYEIDAAFAGKKSRCKQCGEVFRVPVPSAVAGQSSPPGKSPASAEAGSRALERSFTSAPASPPKAGRAAAPPDQARLVAPAIVVNCPRCRKRHELDVVLAGKKSKCKQCGEMFSIPVPAGHSAESSSSRAPATIAREPAAAPSRWQSVLEDEPAALKASRRPAVAEFDDVDLPPPPRAAYPAKRRRSRDSADAGQISVALTISGWYSFIGLLLAAGVFVYGQFATPSRDQTAAVCGGIFLFLYMIGGILSLWGSIWLLVIAFTESIAQGLLCLLVPCYAMGYIVGRFEKCKGAAALSFSMLLVVTVFAAAMMIDAVMRFGRPGQNDGELAGAGPFPAGSDAHYQRFLAEYGDRMVTIFLTGLPTNSDPSQGVTTRDVNAALDKRMRELAPSATNFLRQQIDNKSTVVLAPVDDVEALARSIDFGTATVNGRRIDVVVSTDYTANVPRLPAESPRPGLNPSPVASNSAPQFPAGADDVEKSLIQLKSSDVQWQKEGAQRLGRMFPDHRLDQVVAALLPLLAGNDDFLVIDVIKTLAVWRSPEAVPALIERVSDSRVFVRHEAIKALAKSKDERAVEPILARIKEDGFQVADALKEMGAVAEPALIERLTNPDPDVRRQTCRILSEIGGTETLKAMQALPADPDHSVRFAASEAMKAIVARVGPLAPSKPQKGAAESPFRRKAKP
jgi:hypothetical protein